ncbi:hypothetical protein PsorP6_005341 [Peronosclerospora sorghi]|uniref:Uncharacterized protein n=1 Tax=Peronosclerospora sorghi TaxID=230839 RepID=A0ACC0W4V8_9STRA|nr:hypothetical protein PsorP6_005341 [Peronosclerospora sorghi]
MRLIRSISKLHPSWLASQTVIIECLRKLWRSPARIQRLLAHDRLPIKFHLESKLLISCNEVQFWEQAQPDRSFLRMLRDPGTSEELKFHAIQLLIMPVLTISFEDPSINNIDVMDLDTVMWFLREILASKEYPPDTIQSLRIELLKHVYDTPPKIVLQVYVALFRTHEMDARFIVRKAFDILLPALPSRLPSNELIKAIKWTKKIAWSARFEADPKRLSWQDECITPRSAGNTASSGCVLYELGVSDDYAKRHFGSVTLVSVIPRYMILNRSQRTLLLLETSHRQLQRPEASSNDNVAHHVLGPGDMYALVWVCEPRALLLTSVLINKEASASICEEGYDWSESFAVVRAGTTDLLVPPRASGRGVHLEVVVKKGSLSQATFLLVVSDLSANSPASPPSGLLAAASLISSSTKNVVAERGWQTFSFHAQMTGVIITITDTNTEE